MQSHIEPGRYNKISEMKDLVKTHIQENKLCRETDLELLRNLDKELDDLNRKLDKIKERTIIDTGGHGLTGQNVIDLSFFPINSVDFMDDLEEKLSRDYDYKQNMIETVCQFGDTEEDVEKETRKFIEIMFTTEMLYDFTYEGTTTAPYKIRFKEYQNIIQVLYYVVLKNFDNFTLEDTITIIKNYLIEIAIKQGDQ